MVQQINLYDPALRPRRERWRAVHGLWAVAGVLVLGFAGARALDALAQRRAEQADALAAQLASERQLLARNGGVPSAAGGEAELEHLRQREAAQRRVHAELDNQTTLSVPGYSPYLFALARQSGETLWITGFKVGADGQALEIDGRMTDAAALPTYLRRLNAEPLFKGRDFAQLDVRAAVDGPQAAPANAGFTDFMLRSVPPGTSADSVFALETSR